MKKILLIAALVGCWLVAFPQIDTISGNLYQFDGRIGIGRINSGGYFNPLLAVHNGWMLITDSTNHDAGFVVAHLHRNGYGFARTLHQVFEGVNGDPYTEFRIRDSYNDYTVTSWAIGSCNQDDDKLVFSNATYTATGASPSIGDRVIVMKTTGEVGIGTSYPEARLHIADGDIYISDIDRGIIMKSPDGQCWKGVMENTGNLKFYPVDCGDLVTMVFQPSVTTKEIVVYPNPASNHLFLEVKNAGSKNLDYKLTSITGQEVGQGSITDNIEKIDLTNYSPGTYTLSVYDHRGEILSSGTIIIH